MRIVVLIGALVAAVLWHANPSSARSGAWCLSIEEVDCSIPSYGACRLAAMPENGDCYRNAHYQWRGRQHAAFMFAPEPRFASGWGWRGGWAGGWGGNWGGGWGGNWGGGWGRGWGWGYEPSYAYASYDSWHGRPYRENRHWAVWSGSTQGPWCLTIELTDCSQPSWGACNFTAMPESGHCYPNPRYWHGRAHARSALMRHNHGRGYMAAARPPSLAAARALGATGDLTARPAAADRSGADAIARASAADDRALEAFAMADTSAVAPPSAAAAPIAPPPVVPDRRPAPRANVPTINVTASCRAAAAALGGIL